MNIYETLECCYLEQQHLTPEIRKQVIKSFNLDQWLAVTKTFIRGLDLKHNVPGKELQKIYDFINWYEDKHMWTWEQQWNLLGLLVDYWDQMSCESRAKMML
jgi:hypothetical protein